MPIGEKEIKGASVKAGEKVDAGSLKYVEKQQRSSEAGQSDVPVSKKKSAASPSQDDTYNFKVSVQEFTGKEKQRYWEWVKLGFL
jgi:hypothetical protein